jgi:Cdc6-like AAA superfamily ATPase
MGERDLEVLRDRLSEVFKPGQAIDKYNLFAGRLAQATAITNVIRQPGNHAILYGERGIGKTSLAKVLHEILQKKGVEVTTAEPINCDWSDNFSSLWHKTFRRIVVESTAADGKIEPNVKTLEDLLPEDVTPNDVRTALGVLTEPSVIVIDELNRLQDHNTKILLADTIKTLSDQSVNATLVLIGVADNVEEIMAEHISIERSLVPIRMPRMKQRELLEIMEKGLNTVGMGADLTSREMVARLSQGLPYYTHYLGLYSGYNALDADRDFIEIMDVLNACEGVVENNVKLLGDFYKATRATKKNIYEEVFIACAVTVPDDLGFFAPASVCDPLTTIMGKPYYVTSFTRHINEFYERGALQRIGEKNNYYYRFVDPLMQPFAIIYGIHKRIISPALVIETQRRSPFENEIFNGGYGENVQEDLPF